MKEIFKSIGNSLKHLESLHIVFSKPDNYEAKDKLFTYELYTENEKELKVLFEKIDIYGELYGENSRQMILSDLYEYFLLGRGYYSLKNKEQKESFIAAILRVVNILMCYEAITVSDKLRIKVLEELGRKIPSIKNESNYDALIKFKGKIGIPDSKADSELSRYFDKMLPKTAGGLWHELLVYIFC